MSGRRSIEPGREIRSHIDKDAIELQGHVGDVETARFSQDGRWIVSTGINGTAKLWDAITGQVVSSFSGGSIRGAWLSADSGSAFNHKSRLDGEDMG